MLGLPGDDVERITEAPTLPHIGWNRLEVQRPHPVLEGCPTVRRPTSSTATCPHPTIARLVAETEHGGRFASLVAHDRIIGFQFHPERSGADGLRILANALELVASRAAEPAGRLRPDAPPPRHPLPRRQGRPGRQGRELRRPQGRGRPARAAPLRRGRRRRTAPPRHQRHRRAGRPSSRSSSAPPDALRPPHRGRGRPERRRHEDPLRPGADKVAVNTAAVRDPSLIATCARRFGRQCVVVSVDVRARADSPGTWEVVVQGGRQPTGLDAADWVERAVELGAGEVLLTSIDRDGTQGGFDLALLARSPRGSRAGHRLRWRRLPGRHGRGRHRRRGRRGPGGVDFHRDIHSIGAVKAAMAEAGVPVRLPRRRGLMPGPRTERVAWRPSRLRRLLHRPALRYGPDGLVAAVVQDALDGRVLMVGWQDAEAIEATLRTGEVALPLAFPWRALAQGRDERPTPWRLSRSSSTAMLMPSSSARGHRSDLPHGRAFLLRRAARRCRRRNGGRRRLGLPRHAQGFAWLERLWDTIEERAGRDPTAPTRAAYIDGGVDAVARKLAEEATEVVLAAKDDEVADARAGSDRAALAGELADLLYHPLVLCDERGLPPAEVIAVLRARHSA